MTATQAGLRDAAHRKFKDRAFQIRLSDGRVEADLVSQTLTETNGYAHYAFTITTDGAYEAAPRAGVLARWAMDQVVAQFSASGATYQFESAYLVDASAVTTPLLYVVSDSTVTVFNGGDPAEVRFTLEEISVDA